jgi:hypothetical protein
VLAFLLLAAFDNSLDNRVNALALPPSQKVALQAEEVNLGSNDILKGASNEDRAAINQAVDQAFISVFRFVMFVSPGMAVTSAIAAAILLQGTKATNPANPVPTQPASESQ